MKSIKFSLLISLIFFSSIFGNNQTLACEVSDPLLVVVLMVKNEQDVIVPTLKPFVDGGIDAFYIFDTDAAICQRLPGPDTQPYCKGYE